MAPLAELSTNRLVKPKQNSLDGGSTASSKRPLAQKSPVEHHAHVPSLPTAGAVQSMLKTATELGDLGDLRGLALKPTRIPRAHTVNHPRTHRHHRLRVPYPDHTVGTHISRKRYYHTHHDQLDHGLRHHRSPRVQRDLASDLQDRGSESLTQSSNPSRRVSIHASLRNLQPHALAGPRPRSPRRLRREGCRPTSPAYSEFIRSGGAGHSGSHRIYSPRTTSPMSMSSSKKVHAVWNYGFNRSDPVLQRYQTVPFTRRHDINRSPPFSRRLSRASPPLASYRSSLASKSQVSKPSGTSQASERAPSPRPLFYDYSEPFEKESFRHTAQRSSMFTARQIPQSDGSSEGYQTDATNTSANLVKDTHLSHQPKATTPKRAAGKEKPPSPLRLVSNVLKQEPSDEYKDLVGPAMPPAIQREPAASLPNSPATSQRAKIDLRSTCERGSMVDAGQGIMLCPFATTTSPDMHPKPPSSTYDPAPKVLKAAGVSIRLSSSSGSQYSGSGHSGQDRTLDILGIKAPPTAYERQPKALSVTFDRLETLRNQVIDAEPQQRAASLDTRIRPAACEIFSPVPERSMSSRDSRDRFSRILSIGEDFGKRDFFSNPAPAKKAPITIQQYLRDKKSHSPKSAISAAKELPPLPDDPPRVLDKGKGKEMDETLVQTVPNETPTSPSLMKQNPEVFPVLGFEHVAALNGFNRPGIPTRYSSVSCNSLVDLPGLAQSIRASLLSQKSSNEEQPRKLAISKRNSSLLQTMKELPPLPKETAVPSPAPQATGPLELPFSSIPLAREGHSDSAMADVLDVPKLKIEVMTEIEVVHHTPPRTVNVGFTHGGDSTDSPGNFRPWNLDASYPWAGTPPRLDVSLPETSRTPPSKAEKVPRFKLRLHRSSVLGNSGKLTKARQGNLIASHSPSTSSQITPGRTRFTEGLGDISSVAPSIGLVPPSPGLKLEAQSFFSDDSSHKQRGSFKTRLSHIKGLTKRMQSSDDIRGSDRRLASSGSGGSKTRMRSSNENSTSSVDEIRQKITKWKMMDTIRSWLHRQEEKFKRLRGKITTKLNRRRAVNTHE